MTWYSGFPDTAEGWAEFNRNEAAKNAARNRREAREAQEEINERLNDITNALMGNAGAAELIKLKRRIRELEEENKQLRQKLNKQPRNSGTYGYMGLNDEEWTDRMLDRISKISKSNEGK